MTILKNDEIKKDVGAGVYAFKATGALDVQFQLADEGFSTITDASFSGASDGVIELPSCQVKVINATTESFIFNKIRGVQ